MEEGFVPRAGAVFSADIAHPDHARALRFYSRVLATGTSPLWREDLLNSEGLPVIGLGPRTEDHKALPLQWMPHIQVTDVAASARTATQLGGKVLMQSTGDGVTVEWAVLADPNGAAFGIVPVLPPEAIPAPPASPRPAGRIAWLDITVPGADETRDFYRHVVGWAFEDVEIIDGSTTYSDYNLLGPDGTPLAGVCHARGANAGLPPVWMIYLPVGDLGESVQRVEEEGGRVLKSTRSEDGGYAYVAVADPSGAVFALLPG